MQRRWMIVVLAVAAALALAACGGGDDDDSAGRAPAEAATQSEEAEASDQAEDEDEGDAGDDRDSPFASALLDDDCAFVLGGPGLEDAVAGLEGDFGEVADAWQRITDRSPDAIRADMQVMSDTFRQMAEILAEVDLTNPQALTDPDNQAKLLELNEVLDADAFNDASDAVEGWFEENCTG